MSKPRLEIALPLNPDRSTPVDAFRQGARAIRASGLVDYVHIWDQLMGWWPPHLWNTDNSPLAATIPDLDSTHEAATAAAFACGAAPGLGVTISTDAIRHGPAEGLQTMLSLASFGAGKAILQLGAGEVKQMLPFGWNRAEGLQRQEDHLRFYDEFWRGNGEVSFKGKCWNFDRAWIGGVRPERPRVYALGGGPKLIDLAATYADGFATVTPNVVATPERFALTVKDIRERVAAKGRDPEQFGFLLWVFALIHDDPAVIRRALDNPLMRWLAAIYGRMNMADWAGYGEESAFPLDWHYAMKLIPNRHTDRAEVDRILSRTTRRMTELCFITGSAEEVARQTQAYVDAGATCIDLVDMLPLVLDPEDARAGLRRQLDVCARLRASNA